MNYKYLDKIKTDYQKIEEECELLRQVLSQTAINKLKVPLTVTVQQYLKSRHTVCYFY